MADRFASLFCDASWCPRTFAGGWGAWIKSDTVSVGRQFSGSFSSVAQSSDDAELMAAACALHCGLRSSVILPHFIVLFQIDNQRALKALNTKWKPVNVSPMMAAAREVLMRLRKDNQLQFRTRHVKAHKPNRHGTRFAVNNLCDQLAKQRMREARVALEFKL